MRFYSNVNKSRNKQVLFLEFSENEARHLGGENPLGTHLDLHQCNNDKKKYVLTADYKGRARLHYQRPGRSDILQAVFAIDDGAFPISGRTPLLHNQIEEGFALRPFDSEIISVQPRKEYKRLGKVRTTSHLPLNKPAQSVELKSAATTEEEIRAVVTLINETMDRLPEKFSVDLRIENNRVRATLHVTI
jgi:hypothetical protein